MVMRHETHHKAPQIRPKPLKSIMNNKTPNTITIQLKSKKAKDNTALEITIIVMIVIQNWVVRFGHVDTHRRETWADYPRSLGGIAPQQYPDDDEEEEGSWSKREQKFI